MTYDKYHNTHTITASSHQNMMCLVKFWIYIFCYQFFQNSDIQSIVSNKIININQSKNMIDFHI